ncbi:MAG: hypothetical protein ABEJ82_04145 [Haloplanus sp.]
MRALPVLAAALVVCAAVGGVAGGLSAASPPSSGTARPSSTPTAAAVGPAAGVAQTESNETTATRQIRVLDVPRRLVSRSTVRTHYVDLGPGVTLSSSATTDRLQTLGMVERIEAANTSDQRRARLRTALDELESQVKGLDERQERAIADYAAKRISPRDFLVRMVEISHTAQELDDRRARLEALADESPGFELDRGRLASIRHRIDTFTGPVRAHARRVLRGDADPDRFYVVTGPKSVAISTISGSTYLREAYRGDLHDGDGERIQLEKALEIVSSSYPVLWESGREQTQVFGGGDSYPVRVAHARGDLTAFVDSTAGTVFAEHQRRPLDSMVTDARFQSTGDDLRLVVNHTYPGGPMQVRVTDAAGDPVDAVVSVEGTGDDAGRTGTDGTLWTLSPGGRFSVTATRNGESVSVPVAAGASPRVHMPAPPRATNPTPAATNPPPRRRTAPPPRRRTAPRPPPDEVTASPTPTPSFIPDDAARPAVSNRATLTAGSVVVLVLAVAVGTAVVGVGLGAMPSDPTVAALSLSVDGDRLAVTHRAGEPLDVRRLDVTVRVDGTPLAHQPPIPFFSARGFDSGPTGPFNARADPTWTAGERATLRLASTNRPDLHAGAHVVVDVRRDGRLLARLSATA